MFQTVLAVACGASLGAIMRWFLSEKLNHIYPAIPLGTLGSNLIGGYLVGIAIGFFAVNDSISPEWKLFIITGFLGGLTTFSSFSAEIVATLQQGRWLIAITSMSLHVFGSILMTFLGIGTYFLLTKNVAN